MVERLQKSCRRADGSGLDFGATGMSDTEGCEQMIQGEHCEAGGRAAGWRMLVRFGGVLAFGLWLGGLTFYSAIVVPIGRSVLGGMPQSSVTQPVTIRINVLGLIAGLIVIADGWLGGPKPGWKSRRVWLGAALVLLQFGLFYEHSRLSVLWERAIQADKPTGSVFYGEHRVYLVLTTIQWFVGLAVAWKWFSGSRR